MGYSHIIQGLAQGSYPEPGTDLSKKFDVLVLCAMELQEVQLTGAHVLIVKCPLDDGPPPSRIEIRRAWSTATFVAKELKRGRRVLVTCAMGRNRSGLVTGMTLRMMGLSGKQAVDVIRIARGPDALSNKHFVKLIKQVKPASVVGARAS